MASFGERMVRAAKCDVAIYEEVEADASATGQALTVVVLASVAAGLALGGGVRGLVVGAVASVIGWALWALLIYWIGARWLPEPETNADWGQLLRTLGFASAPGIVRVVGIVPGLRGLVFLAVAVWMFVTTVTAVRQALDYRSTWRAVGVCLLGWLVQWLLFALVLGLLRRA
jgi:hypothetical protein